MSNSDVKNRMVVITGATKGLGKAIALTFAKADYQIIGLYRSDADAAGLIDSEFKADGLRGRFIRQDITENGEWAEFDEIVEASRDKHFTVIANASPPFVPKPFHLGKWTEFSQQLEVNVKGTFQLFSRLLPSMVSARRGTLITILSSALAQRPKGFAAYLTAKSALKRLTEAIAAEYAERGLRVFSVSPGFMETALTDAWSEHLKAAIHRGSGATNSPEHVAQLIFDLAEDPGTKGEGENYLLDRPDHKVAAED